MRLKLVPQETNWDFFSRPKLWLGISVLMIVLALLSFGLRGLNYGIDFRGGTTIRTESAQTVDVGAYRDALAALELGDVTISEVFDPTFGEDENVAMIRIQAQEEGEAISGAMIGEIQAALDAVAPGIKFVSVESVGPKVSGELVQTAVIAVALAIGAVLVYIWLRFEWQFALGAVAALVHDVILTIGIFSELQIKFDLAIIAALLTIVGYSLNDTVVVFDRVRENLLDRLSALMITLTTLLALVSLYVLGGDVIRGFVFAMIWGVIVGTYSSVFVASAILLYLGVKRDWTKPTSTTGNQFANIDA